MIDEKDATIRWGSKFPFFSVPNTIFDQVIMVIANERVKGQGKPSIVKREIRTIEKLIYIYLARCCSNDAAQGFPSYETIARKCGISRWAAIHAVDTLSRTGLLAKQLRKKGRVNETNIYELFHPEDLLKNMSQADLKGGGVLGTPGQYAEHTRGGVLGTPTKRKIYKNKYEKRPTEDEDRKKRIAEKEKKYADIYLS